MPKYLSKIIHCRNHTLFGSELDSDLRFFAFHPINNFFAVFYSYHIPAFPWWTSLRTMIFGTLSFHNLFFLLIRLQRFLVLNIIIFLFKRLLFTLRWILKHIQKVLYIFLSRFEHIQILNRTLTTFRRTITLRFVHLVNWWKAQKVFVLYWLWTEMDSTVMNCQLTLFQVFY